MFHGKGVLKMGKHAFVCIEFISFFLFYFVPSVCCNSIFPSVNLYSLDKGVGAFVTALNASVTLCVQGRFIGFGYACLKCKS